MKESARRVMIRRFKMKPLTEFAWLGMAVLICFVSCSDGQEETDSDHASHNNVVQETAEPRGSLQSVLEDIRVGE